MNNEALQLLLEIANKATLEEGEVDKDLLYEAFFEELNKRREQQ